MPAQCPLRSGGPPPSAPHTTTTALQEGVEDPLFIYANRAALELFEASWDELIGLPSRKSVSEADKAAEDKTLADRQQLLDAAATSGAVTNYEG